MKQRNHAGLRGRLEVDQQVTAGDDIHLRERSIPQQIMLRENAHIANVFADAVHIFAFREEPPETLRGDVALDIFRIYPAARLDDALFADIGAEKLNGNTRRAASEK